MADDKPLTKETLENYIDVLEKQIQQTTLVIMTLKELNEKFETIEAHFHNGFKGEIIEHISDETDKVSNKLEKALTTIYISKENLENSMTQYGSLKEKVVNSFIEIKEKILDLKTSLKIDRTISILGWSSILITLIIKLFMK